MGLQPRTDQHDAEGYQDDAGDQAEQVAIEPDREADHDDEHADRHVGDHKSERQRGQAHAVSRQRAADHQRKKGKNAGRKRRQHACEKTQPECAAATPHLPVNPSSCRAMRASRWRYRSAGGI
jgi:hypothetical protein